MCMFVLFDLCLGVVVPWSLASCCSLMTVVSPSCCRVCLVFGLVSFVDSCITGTWFLLYFPG